MSADLIRIYHKPITTFQYEFWLIDGFWVEISRYYDLKHSLFPPEWSAVFAILGEDSNHKYYYTNCVGHYYHQNREVIVDGADEFSKDLIEEIVSVFAPPFEEVKVTYA